ncbi:MAG: MFS transporter, partial [Aurantimicrobium sp.]
KQVTASPDASLVSAQTQSALTQSFSSATALGARYPTYQSAIEEAAKFSFIHGSALAYAVGFVLVFIGAALVFVAFPGKEKSLELFDEYHTEDAAVAPASAK